MTASTPTPGRPRFLTVTLRSVAPIFAGGPQPEASSELRPTAIRGLLRFWFRALGLGAPAEEAALFGGAGAGAGQGVLSILPAPAVRTSRNGGWDAPIGYLGYGVLDRNRQTKRFEPNRPFVPAGEVLTLELLFHPRASPGQVDAVLRSLWGLCHFGGLGSRSRRGWGSVALMDVRESEGTLPGWVTPVGTTQQLVTHLRSVLSSLKLLGAQPRHTAFSTASRILVREVAGGWETALRWVGGELQSFRSYWRKPAPLFPDDHDGVLRFLDGKGLGQAPARAVFGLPHNYFFKHRNDLGAYPEKAQISARLGRQELGRRASPLLLHVHPLEGQRHAVVLTFLPAEFLPHGAEIVARAASRERDRRRWKATPADATAPPPPDYSAVTRFLDQVRINGGQSVDLVTLSTGPG